jgi:hypothetical protein
MAYYQAIGTGPVSFLDDNEEQQELPLSAIFIGPSGADASASPLDTAANQPVINALLAQMISAGYLAPAANPFLITATAAQPGPSGNSITLTFSSPDKATGTFDASVTVTENYSALTTTTILSTLAKGSSQSGLVYVEAGSGLMPVATAATAIGGASGLNIADTTSGTAFTLVPINTSDAADMDLIEIAVAPISPPTTPVAFNLTVSWTKAASGTTVAALTGSNPFAYVISLAAVAPSSLLPAPTLSGSVTLSGGSPASGSMAAVAASGNILDASV